MASGGTGRTGRPSKLTDATWEIIGRRYLNGEGSRKLAAEFKISESAIRLRLSAQSEKIKKVANQIVETERNLRSLPISAQLDCVDLASTLRAISSKLATAAHHGASTASRLAQYANEETEKIDSSKPFIDNVLAIQNIDVLSGVAFNASKIGLNLMAANKEFVAQANQEREINPTTMPNDAIEASRAYQRLLTDD